MYPKKYIITFCLIWPLNFHTFIFHEIEFFTSKKIIDIGSGGTNKIKENYSYTHWTFLGVTNRKNKSMKWPCSLTYNNYFSVNSNFYSSEAQTVLSTRKKRLKIPWLYILRSYKTRLIIIRQYGLNIRTAVFFWAQFIPFTTAFAILSEK